MLKTNIKSTDREWLGVITPVEDAHCPSADGVGGLDRTTVAMAVELTGILHQCCQRLAARSLASCARAPWPKARRWCVGPSPIFVSTR